MWLIIIIVVLLLVWIILRLTVFDKQDVEYYAKESEKEERRKQNEANLRKKFESEYQLLLNRFGTCTVDVKLGRTDMYIESRLFIFEDSQMIVLYGDEYKFSDILGFSLVDDATSETITTSTGDAKTSTGSMIGRAVVGGVLTGGLGAVAGAATAKKNIVTNATSQTTTTHKYTMYVNVNSLSNPTVTIRIGDDSQKAHKLANLFNVIMARVKQNNHNNNH